MEKLQSSKLLEPGTICNGDTQKGSVGSAWCLFQTGHNLESAPSH